MDLKVFISSKMRTKEDFEFRESARNAIADAGFLPVLFETSADRPYDQYEDSADDPCVEAVKHADLFVFIIESHYTSGMKAEYYTARIYLGEKKILYFFRHNTKRSLEVQDLRSFMIKENRLNEFETAGELAEQVKSSLEEYAGSRTGEGPDTIYDESIEMRAGRERHLHWNFDKGDNIYITVVADGNVFAEFLTLKEYRTRRDISDKGMFQFEFGSDRPSFVFNQEIKESDTYYLVIRSSRWSETRNVNVRVVTKIPMRLEYLM